MSDRIACLVPGCRRTAPRSFYPDADAEIICGKHFKLVPLRLKTRYRDLKKRRRMVEHRLRGHVARGMMTEARADAIRSTFVKHADENWEAIRNYFLAPAMPVGLEAVLEELRLA